MNIEIECDSVEVNVDKKTGKVILTIWGVDKDDVRREVDMQIKPCPWCGGNGDESNDGDNYWVRCCTCGAESPYEYNKEDAFRVWNARGKEEQK